MPTLNFIAAVTKNPHVFTCELQRGCQKLTASVLDRMMVINYSAPEGSNARREQEDIGMNFSQFLGQLECE